MENKNLTSMVSPIPLFRRSKTVFRNFLIVASIFFGILLAATVTIYLYAGNIIRSELVHTNENAARNVTQSVDSLIEDMQYITASLAANNMVNFYFQTSNSAAIFEGFTDRITEQINAYVQGFEYIHSIYIYSEKNGSCITSSGEVFISSIKDSGWLELLSSMDGKNGLFARKVNGSYPFVLSVIHHSKTDDGEGYIVLNLNLRKLPNVLQTATISSAYIITDDGEVLYRKNQEDILEPLSISRELESYQSSDTIFSSFIDGADPYIYTQMPSSHYPWSYVTVTHLLEYTPQLTQLRNTLVLAFILLLTLFIAVAFLLSVGSYRPILKLLQLLNNPANWNSAQNMDEKDIENIVQQITTYVQTNTQLSDELQSRLVALKSTQLVALQAQINPHFMLNTLNLIHGSIVKSLGYDHFAADMALHLGRLLGYALDTTFLVSISEEIKYTECYLSILRARYENKIQVHTILDPDTADIKIPKLLLQPVIENCIYHGVENSLDTDLNITVKSTKCTQIPAAIKQIGSNPVLITIEDDGVGMCKEKVADLNRQLQQEMVLTGSHIGLKNIVARLRLLYGDYCLVEISSVKGTGTCVSIFLFADNATVPTV